MFTVKFVFGIPQWFCNNNNKAAHEALKKLNHFENPTFAKERFLLFLSEAARAAEACWDF